MSDWIEIGKEGFEKLAARAKKFQKLKPKAQLKLVNQFSDFKEKYSIESRKKIYKNHSVFKRADTLKQSKIRKNYSEWSSLAPQDKKDIDRKHQIWLSMSDKERQKIRKEIREADQKG